MAGRPKKAPAAQPEVVAAENNSKTAEQEAAAMKEQVAYQLATLLKMAEKMNIDLDAVFPKPPKEVTITEEAKPVAVEPVIPGAPIAPVAPVQAPFKPGQATPGGGWIQWKKSDLNPEDTVTFIPLPVPGIVYPFLDENGYQKIKLDVNSLVCWLTCGVENTVNRYFWNVYNEALTGHRELEAFKRNGPSYAPWGSKGPDGGPAWLYVPQVATFAMDDRGHSLRIGGPTPLDMPEISAPEAPAEPQK